MKRNLVWLLKRVTLILVILIVCYYCLFFDGQTFTNDPHTPVVLHEFDFILNDFTPHYVQNKAKILECK